MKVRWIAVVVLLLAMCACASASLIYVDQDSPASVPDGKSWATAFHEVDAALVTAANGSIIWIAQGTYDESGLSLFEDISLIGGFAGYGETNENAWDPAVYVTTIDGGGQNILRGDDVLGAFIQGITFRNAGTGYENGDGGAIYLDSVQVVIEQCTFQDCSVFDYGGGIYAYDSDVALTDCTFTGCTAIDSGGGFAADECTAVSLANCTFTGNQAEYGGGAYVYSGGLDVTATFTDCTFGSNDATTINITSGDVKRLSDVYGGGLCLEDAAAEVDGCDFTDNASDGYGGGADMLGSSATFTDCDFDGNTATQDGGAIDSEGSLVTVGRTSFTSNESYDGGAIYFGGTLTPSLVRSRAMDNPNYDLVLACTFSDNVANVEGSGGAIYFVENLGSEVASNMFYANESGYGGALAFTGATASVTNNSFFNNDANYNGGGVYVAGGGGAQAKAPETTYDVAINNCIFAWNMAEGGGGDEAKRAALDGGAAFVAYPETAIIGHSCAWENTPNDYGGNASLGDGNIYEDPNVNENDGHLLLGSPCIDTGWNGAPGFPEIDIDGFARIVNDIVDMGADEYGNEEEGHDMAVTAVTGTPNPMSFPVPATFTVTVKNNGSVTEDAARVKVFVNGVQVG